MLRRSLHAVVAIVCRAVQTIAALGRKSHPFQYWMCEHVEPVERSTLCSCIEAMHAIAESVSICEALCPVIALRSLCVLLARFASVFACLPGCTSPRDSAVANGAQKANQICRAASAANAVVYLYDVQRIFSAWTCELICCVIMTLGNVPCMH